MQNLGLLEQQTRRYCGDEYCLAPSELKKNHKKKE